MYNLLPCPQQYADFKFYILYWDKMFEFYNDTFFNDKFAVPIYRSEFSKVVLWFFVEDEKMVTLYFKVQFSLSLTINMAFYLNKLPLCCLLTVSKVVMNVWGQIEGSNYAHAEKLNMCFISTNKQTI